MTLELTVLKSTQVIMTLECLPYFAPGDAAASAFVAAAAIAAWYFMVYK